MTDLQKYTKLFSTLHTAKVKGQKAPHKAILLLTIIDLIEKGVIVSTHIELSEDLVNCFSKTWKYYLGNSSLFTVDISKPFFHMQHESFWKLVDYKEACMMMVAEDCQWIEERKDKKELPHGSYSLKALRSTFAYAEIDNTMFLLLKNADSREKIKNILIDVYLKNQPTIIFTHLTPLILVLPLIAIVA